MKEKTDGLTMSQLAERNAEYVTTIAELEARCAALAAENAGLKAGAYYFSYGSEHNFEWHKNAEEAIEAAEAAIDDYRGDACDGWSEEVDSVCWGIILQSSTKVGERPRNEDDSCDPAIDTICDYALLPNIETPATNAFLAEVRDNAIPEGYVLVPQQIFLEPSDIESICSQCGDGHESGYGDFTDGLLWVGNIQRDDGSIVHGMHISSADYTEEGGVTVCAVAAQLRQEAK